MSIDSALQRVTTISQALANPASLVGSSTALAGGTVAPGAIATATSPAAATATATTATAASSATTGTTSFASALQSATSSYAPAGVGPGPGAGAGTGAGERIVAAAESQVGQTEQPPGSNDSPAIAEYRSATAGAMPGAPWCAYFASWAARQAGDPIGSQGQGLGSVSEMWSWAQSSGRAIANGPGVVPKPGDLIVFGGEHVGVVKGVLPDGSIQTIEGNYNNQVSANVRPAGEASGYVSMS
jgi:hypothetical protein